MCACGRGHDTEAPIPDEILEKIFGVVHSAEPEADFASEEEVAEYVASLPPGTVFIDGHSEHRDWHSVSSQIHRTYVYTQGEYTVLGPQLVHPTDEGGELVYDDSGNSHFMTAGFLAVTWATKPGAPNFAAELR